LPPFPKPGFSYAYQLPAQLLALRSYRDTKPGRQIPPRAPDRLLVGTWNVANLGVQERRPQDYALIAEVVSWLELVAIQESNDNLRGIRGVQAQLPDYWRRLFSDAAGNNEEGSGKATTSAAGGSERCGHECGAPGPRPALTIVVGPWAAAGIRPRG
jgi:hypothetical protein